MQISNLKGNSYLKKLKTTVQDLFSFQRSKSFESETDSSNLIKFNLTFYYNLYMLESMGG